MGFRATIFADTSVYKIFVSDFTWLDFPAFLEGPTFRVWDFWNNRWLRRQDAAWWGNEYGCAAVHCSRTLRAARIGALSVSIFGLDHSSFSHIILALEYPGIISAWSSIRPEVWVTAPVHLTFLQILQSFGGRRTERTEREFKWQWISIQVTAFVGDGDTFAYIYIHLLHTSTYIYLIHLHTFPSYFHVHQG